MATQNTEKLNRLAHLLPEGLLVDAAWLSNHGYSTSLRSQYVAGGWLEHPARQVYQRPRSRLSWQQAVMSLQGLLGQDVVVGGRSALELKGFAHYLAPADIADIHLYGPVRLPSWLSKLPLTTRFIYHNNERLFRNPATLSKAGFVETLTAGNGVTNAPWEWPMMVSSPERAVLELLDELPGRETFHQVDKLVEGLANLSPRRLEKILLDCHSVKVKRLFFFFADRHRHAWLKRINKSAIDLGKGKRMLVRGGKLNAAYQITVPADLDGVQ